MDNIKLPICIAEGYDIFLYKTIEKAQVDLEVIDVNDKIYKGYDAEGRLLYISARNDLVDITLAENEPNHKEDLEKLLRYCLEYSKIDLQNVKKGDLGALLKHAEIFLVKY